MRIRAGILLINNNNIALIKRTKPARLYYVVPGGGVDEGEYTDEAAIREAKEELGIDVQIQKLVAIVERVEWGRVTHVQMYYHGEMVGGTFGQGVGEEYDRNDEHSSYEAVWFPLSDVEFSKIYPSALIKHIAEFGIPKQTLHLKEPMNFPS